jgi:hypothetical protein
LAQRRQKLVTRVNEITTSSLNRDFVIAVPGLLGKVLNFACRLPCIIVVLIPSWREIYIFYFYEIVSPRYPLPNTETEQWMTWIDDNMAHSSHSIETVGGFLQGNFIKLIINFQ